MNPFVLNKMHGAFVPDRLTDVVETTPVVPTQTYPECLEAGTDLNNISTVGYYVGAQQQPPIVEKTIAVSIYRFDVAHRGDIAMLMADGDAVKVTCDIVVEDGCRGVDMLSHVFGFAVIPKLAVFIDHDGRNTASVMDMLHRLYCFEDMLIFVVVTHTDNKAAMELVAALMLDNIEPSRKTYGCNSSIYYNPKVIARITEHEQVWHKLVPLTEGRDKPIVGADIDSTIRQLKFSDKHFMSQADMTRRYRTIPMQDTEYYRNKKIEAGLMLTDHIRPSGVGINRLTMAVNYVNHQRIKQRVDVGELVVRHSLRTMDLALPNVYKSTK